jgi:transcriptional regulator with XRE-family HTH domain
MRRGISQHKLAEMIGVTVQQVRKYEWGTNYVSASRPQQIALALRVVPAFVFDGAPIVRKGPKVSARIEEFVSSPEGVALSRAFDKISDRKMRRDIVRLGRTYPLPLAALFFRRWPRLKRFVLFSAA